MELARKTWLVATTFLSGGFSRAVPVVTSFFSVKDFQHNVREDYVEFLIAETEIKSKFSNLLEELGKIGLIATARRSKYFWKLMPTLSSVIRLPIPESVVISVFKMQKQRPKNKYRQSIPALLFIATVCIVFVDGIFRSGWFQSLSESSIQDPLLSATIYTASLMGILGIHEMGHMIANRKHGIRASWPYFIPGAPGFLPTLGALIVLRGNMTNRNVMFDVGMAGPVAGLIVTIIVTVYGSMISTLLPVEEAQQIENLA